MQTSRDKKGPLFEAWPEIEENKDRRAAAARRLAVYLGQFKDEVKKLIDERIADKQSAREIKKFVTASHPLAGTVTDTVSVAYRSGARRELRGVGEPVARAFADLVAESGLPESATTLARLAWISGPMLLLPFVDVVRDKARLCVDQVTANRYEVRCSPSVPDLLDEVLVFRDDGTFVQLDATSWKYFDADGYSLAGGRYDRDHGVGFCPAVVFRSRERLPVDWWGHLDHINLIDATLECAYLAALGRWTRAQTSVPLTVIQAPEDKVPKLQALGHPSRPLILEGAPAETDAKVLDRTTDPIHYLTEIRAVAADAVKRYGLPPGAIEMVTGNSEWGTIALNMTPGALAVQRDNTVPWLRVSERAFWYTTAAVVRASLHRHARVLPDAEAFEMALRAAWPDLSDAKEQIARTQALKERLPLGLANLRHELMAARPELTPTEAKEEIDENLQEYVDTIVPLVERNAPADPGPARGTETPMQQNGREGGEASGESRRAAGTG